MYLQKLTLTSPTSGGRSVGIVRSRTQATECIIIIIIIIIILAEDPKSQPILRHPVQ
jgi:hypothetical protein